MKLMVWICSQALLSPTGHESTSGKTKIPHKVYCSGWLLAKEIALAQHNLMRRENPLRSRFFFVKKKQT